MPTQRLKDFLNQNDVEYVSIKHPPGYTAQEIAAIAHIPGQEMAKTVIVKIDGELAMVVLPAPYKVDLKLLKRATNADKVELASEEEFRNQFPECELGAMPPFGNLYGVNEWVDESLCEDDMITFNAGSHTELVRLSYKKFEELTHPHVAKLHA